jgi:DNA-binding NarL/FixJ family response regulator
MIRIFIIEDHNVTITGLKSYFRPSRDEVVVAISSNTLEEALLIEDPSLFDVIMLDLRLPTGEPMENYKLLEKKFPGKPFVIYTSEESIHWQRKMYKLGARGFLHKSAEKPLIESTIKRVIKGETVYSTSMLEYQTKRKIEGYRDPKYNLTKEQIKIINCYLEGKTTQQVADEVGRDISTINKTMVAIRKIFEVETNIELVIKLLNLKPLDPPYAEDTAVDNQ